MKNINYRIVSFPPIIDEKAEILILGTMPGAMSLAKQEYYGYPRNQFWTIIYTIFSELPVPDNFVEKIKILQQNNLALWDVLADCERKGSLDIQIKNQRENDIENLLKCNPKIKSIIFNGKESHKFFQNKFSYISNLTYHVMPSTSPANTMSFETKLEAWKKGLQSV